MTSLPDCAKSIITFGATTSVAFHAKQPPKSNVCENSYLLCKQTGRFKHGRPAVADRCEVIILLGTFVGLIVVVRGAHCYVVLHIFLQEVARGGRGHRSGEVVVVTNDMIVPPQTNKSSHPKEARRG